MVFEPVFYDVFRQQLMRQQEDVTQERTAIRLSIQNFDVVHTKLIRVIFLSNDASTTFRQKVEGEPAASPDADSQYGGQIKRESKRWTRKQ